MKRKKVVTSPITLSTFCFLQPNLCHYVDDGVAVVVAIVVAIFVVVAVDDSVAVVGATADV